MTTMIEERKESKPLARRWPLFPAFGEPVLGRFIADMERMFEDLNFNFGPKVPPTFEKRQKELVWTPKIDVFEKNGYFVVRAELPGLKKEDVKIEITEVALTLEGERKLKEEEKGEEYYRLEQSYGRFYRYVPLPDGAIFEKADATFKDGILEVTIPVPKKEELKARRLEIKAH